MSYDDDDDDRRLTLPDLQLPRCQVKLVCGPPASGKSTYLKAHAKAGDIVIDFDAIARAHGFGRNRPGHAIKMLLRERNAQLAALAGQSPERTAWVILSAPSQQLRQWWCKALNVAPKNLIVLLPSRGASIARRDFGGGSHLRLTRAEVRRGRQVRRDTWANGDSVERQGTQLSGCGKMERCLDLDGRSGESGSRQDSRHAVAVGAAMDGNARPAACENQLSVHHRQPDRFHPRRPRAQAHDCGRSASGL